MSDKPSIIGIGISGLVGSRVLELLGLSYSFIGLSRETNFNIQYPQTVSFSQYRDASTVILFAAKADVDACEVDKPLGIEGEAWKINVEGVRNVIAACQREEKKLVYFSTDFVFNGDDTPVGGYTEESRPQPINWYGETKYQAEEIVKSSGLDYVIVRPAYPYRAEFTAKKDFVRAILARLQAKQPLKAITDHYYNPTFIDDIASALDHLLKVHATGIYHVVGSQAVSPFEAALQIAEVFGCDENLIAKTTRAEYFSGKAQRPYNLSLNNAKIQQLGVTMRSFDEGLLEMKAQLSNSEN